MIGAAPLGAVCGHLSVGPGIIQPTIGRRVWYWPSTQDTQRQPFAHTGRVLMACDNSKSKNDPLGQLFQPMDAGICYVHDDRMVNLTVADHAGNMHARTNVRLLQPDDALPAEGDAYATWMPYQIRAAESEARQRAMLKAAMDANADDKAYYSGGPAT